MGDGLRFSYVELALIDYFVTKIEEDSDFYSGGTSIKSFFRSGSVAKRRFYALRSLFLDFIGFSPIIPY